MNDEKKTNVYSVTNQIVAKIEYTNNDSARRAILAKLRKSIGKSLSEMTDVWSFLFENLPEEFLGTDIRESFEEKAIVSALQIYATYFESSLDCLYFQYLYKL